MKLKIEVGRDVWEALTAAAEAELRPVGLQMEVILRRGLGLPFPCPVVRGQPETATPVCDAGI